MKNLKDEEYRLISEDSKSLPEEFFGSNITVSSIVGKNGSGKSSILDMIYRIMNNLSAVLCTNLNTETERAFYFIKQLRAEIHYKDDSDNDCMIKCYDDTLWLDFCDRRNERKRYSFGTRPEEAYGYLHIDSLSDLSRSDIMNHLFYCSVVNYAPFTQNSLEYEKEECVKVNDNLQIEADDLYVYNWMQAIFHKNDGYQSPITLTPFRDKGIFDASKEAKLARERLLSLLIVNPDLIPGYEFINASFNINPRRFAEKFTQTSARKENGYSPKMSVREFIGHFEHCLHDFCKHHRCTVASTILYELGYRRENLRYYDTRYQYCYLYLVYKVLNTARYPIFQEYRDICNPDLAISGNNSRQLLRRVRSLTQAVLKENSHITFKIERTKRFIQTIDKLQDDDGSTPFHFILTDYLRTSDFDFDDDDLIATLKALPPSYFDMDIFLTPSNDKKAIVRFEQLSSGERLFYVTISSIIYHAMNLKSIPRSRGRVKYHDMLVILDESEICFHPDYQRTFLNKLINVIKRLRYNVELSFHILLTTHSPFILSDIPASNILYLSEGSSIDAEKAGFINPYGANINDILCQSFFLQEHGFMGEHAKRTIISLRRFLNQAHDGQMEDEEIRWNKAYAEVLIGIIGEPLIREGLLSLYRERYRDESDIRRQIAALRQELAALESKLPDDTNPD